MEKGQKYPVVGGVAGKNSGQDRSVNRFHERANKKASAHHRRFSLA
jgi:hypothetical protein